MKVQPHVSLQVTLRLSPDVTSDRGPNDRHRCVFLSPLNSRRTEKEEKENDLSVFLLLLVLPKQRKDVSLSSSQCAAVAAACIRTGISFSLFS